MAKQNFCNSVALRGYVFSHTLTERQIDPKNGGKAYNAIMGNVVVATDENAMNTVTARFFTRELTKKGTVNATFTNLKQIMEENNTYENNGKNAARVRVDGDIASNDFYGRDGNLVSAKSVRGSFLHFLNPTESFGPNSAFFEADTLVQRVTEKESQNGSEYLELAGYVFNYRGDVYPVTFSVSIPAGVKFFENQELPYYGKLQGSIKSTTVVTEKETEDNDGGFGEEVVQPTTRTFRTWEVISGKANLGMDESTITEDELKAAIQRRETYLATLKQQTEARNGSTSGSAGFPTATKTKKNNPVASSDGFEF